MNGQTIQLLSAALLLLAVGPLHAEDEWFIDWYSIDSGGVIFSESADQEWQMEGTIGQWDATEAHQLSGGGWQLTGGFWGFNLEERSDVLFRDRFEP